MKTAWPCLGSAVERPWLDLGHESCNTVRLASLINEQMAHLCCHVVLSISLRFKRAYSVPSLVARTSAGEALRKSHSPEYAGVQKLRAHCVSVIFAEHSFRESPRNTHVRSEVKSTVVPITIAI